MWGFLDVKKFNLGKILLRFYSIEAFFRKKQEKSFIISRNRNIENES